MSKEQTIAHIDRVRKLMSRAITNLVIRAMKHDESKLRSPEAEIFDEFTPKLAGSTYGSPEYESFLAAMKPALDHHYAHNSHHPEHWPDGVYGMSLLDLLEMVCDWKAATERHNDGDILKSVEINQKRFGYDDGLKKILFNTIRELGFAKTEIPAKTGGNLPILTETSSTRGENGNRDHRQGNETQRNHSGNRSD